MIYVVVEELIPETAQGRHSNLGTIGFALGFALMMILDARARPNCGRLLPKWRNG